MKNVTNHALLVLTPYSRDHASLLRAAKEVIAKNGQVSVLYVTPKIPAIAHHVPEVAGYAQMQQEIADFSSWRRQDTHALISDTISNLWQQLVKWSKELHPITTIDIETQETLHIKH